MIDVTRLVDALADPTDDLLEQAAQAVYLLQRGPTPRRAEKAVRSIFLAVSGAHLTRLKNLVNERPDVYDLEALVFGDIDDATVRSDILEHFAAQAERVACDKVKILSDIDDTVVARLHDTRYPKGTRYPGVLAFFDALDRGPHDRPFSRGDLTFITARPSDAIGLIETATRISLRKAGVSTAAVITGSFHSLLGRRHMADQKVANITRLHQLFPEYGLVFIGDSGQGDVLAAERIADVAGDAFKGAFIHAVTDVTPQQRADYATSNIFVHDTYVGCAVRAHSLGLISQANMEGVKAEALAELDTVAWERPSQRSLVSQLFGHDERL